MSESAAAADTSYVWRDPDGSLEIALDYDVVDSLLPDVIRAFNAVPRRGAETGGILLGSVRTAAGVQLIRITGFQVVESGHERGPSYLLTPAEKDAFATAISAHTAASGSSVVVGYFRSHTRDNLALDTEDRELLDALFPAPETVALLVKPFPTRPPLAGFFPRRNGRFPANTPLEFPFRRRELGGPMPTRRHPPEPPATELAPVEPAPDSPATQEPPSPAAAVPIFRERVRPATPPVWFSLAVVFLALGVLLGVQIALLPAIRLGSGAASAGGIGLSIEALGPVVNIRWIGSAPALRQATRATLVIEDGDAIRRVELDQAALRSGLVVYHPLTETFRVTVDVPVSPRVALTETSVFRRPPGK